MTEPTEEDLRVARDVAACANLEECTPMMHAKLVRQIASALAAEREKAAKKCDALRGDSSKPSDRLIGYEECAEAIRAGDKE